MDIGGDTSEGEVRRERREEEDATKERRQKAKVEREQFNCLHLQVILPLPLSSPQLGCVCHLNMASLALFLPSDLERIVLSRSEEERLAGEELSGSDGGGVSRGKQRKQRTMREIEE